MKRKNTADIVTFIMSASFTVFFVLGLLLLTIVGLRYYGNISTKTDTSYKSRTSLLYLTNKIRQSDVSAGVSIRDWEDGQILVFGETIEGKRYETRIYLYNEALYEVFCPETNAFSPDSGQRITKAEQFNISLDSNNLLTVTVGDNQEIKISLWCEVQRS